MKDQEKKVLELCARVVAEGDPEKPTFDPEKLNELYNQLYNALCVDADEAA